VAGLAILALVMTGCLTGPMSSLDAAGTYARSADHLFEDVFYIVVLVFVLVEGAIVYFLIKYREKPGDPLPVQIHGHTKAEAIWTVIPAIILAAVAIPTIKMIFDFARVPPASTRIDACVTGHQWWWEYQYMKTTSDGCPAGGQVGSDVSVTTANELHIPIKTPIYLTLNSVDVIHSFWVPRLNGKQDVVPGHTNHITIEADFPGTYLGQCSQYCGLSHANMRLRVIAMTRSDYDAWVSAQEQPAVTPTDPTALAGMNLFMNGANGTGKFALGNACSSCHTINGTNAFGTVGPNLTHVQSRQAFAGDILAMNNANLTLWLQNPPKEKPGSDMPDLGLSSDQITELVAYLDTLK
jgi:cytochrome c oxidase subunit 2